MQMSVSRHVITSFLQVWFNWGEDERWHSSCSSTGLLIKEVVVKWREVLSHTDTPMGLSCVGHIPLESVPKRLFFFLSLISNLAYIYISSLYFKSNLKRRFFFFTLTKITLTFFCEDFFETQINHSGLIVKLNPIDN